ncbi:MAG: DinB family protein [Bacteroidetes bacterium]|nr:DinB family protein [Bacteroidota bacterium]
MEKYRLDSDIKVICVTADSFPSGILGAYNTLHSILPSDNGRNFFGISSPNKKGDIIYKAAVEESFVGEAEKLGCDTFVIKKGEYISIPIHNFISDVLSIDRAFKNLIADPGIDPNGVCVEMYTGRDDVRCMVRLDPEKTLSAEIESELNSTFKNFYELISSLTEEQINTISFEGSWTAGQLARHVFKSYAGFVQAINGPVKRTDRKPDELVERSKSLFLNLATKIKASVFITPEEIQYKKEDLLGSLNEIHDKLNESVQTLDMSQTCTAFEIPTFGYLTRLETVYFVMYHTQRHTQQLKNIMEKLNTKG